MVIAIIAILAALLLPALREARESAKAVQCMNNQKQMVIACSLYANENLDQLPSAYQTDSPIISVGGDAKYGWYTLLAPYTGYKKGSNLRTGVTCPTAKLTLAAEWSVGIHEGNALGGVFATLDFAAGKCLSKKLGDLAGGTLLVADLNGNSPGGPTSMIMGPKGWSFAVDTDADGIPDGYTLAHPYNDMAFRHKNLAMAGCADGSVRKVNRAQWLANDGGLWGP